jgi:hypothetical protein
MILENDEERRLWRDYVVAIGPGADCDVAALCKITDDVVTQYRERTRPSSVDLLLARVLRFRWDPLLPETAAAIRERLRDATDDDIAEIIQTGRWPIPDGGPTPADLRGEVEHG